MRFHHSTRRGKSRLSQYSRQQIANSRFPQHSAASTSRWSQLGYCRETNIHFNRRLPVEPAQVSESANNSSSNNDININININNIEQLEMVAVNSGAKSEHKRSIRAKRTGLPEAPSKDGRTAASKQQQIDERLNRLSLKGGGGGGGGGAVQLNQKAAANEHSTIVVDNKTQLTTSAGKLNMESVRAKLVAQVEKHPFWSNKAARKMQLTGLEERRVYVYELISYCERRELEWRYESYKGGLIGSSATGGHQRRLPLVASDTSSSTHLATPIRSSLYLGSKSGQTNSTRNVPLSSPSSPTNTNASGDSFWSPSLAGSGASSNRAAAVATTKSASSIRRSVSGNATPTCGAAEPTVSAMERQMPSKEMIWALEVPVHLRPQAFVGYVHSTEIANSSFVKRCHGCQGRGRLKCNSCYGVGYEVCISCSGKGTTKSLSAASAASGSSSARYANRSYGLSDHEYHTRHSSSANPDNDDNTPSAFSSVDNSSRCRGAGEPGGITLSGSSWVSDTCHNCHGAGQKRCWVCAGKSYNHCLGCLGSGQLRCYLNLNITWSNHRDESTLNNNDNIIPNDRLKLSTGLQLADEISERLKPLKCELIDGASGGLLTDSNQIYLASKKLLEKHNQTYKQEKLLKQRHKVTQIECYVISYEWKQRRGHFVIYGDEHKVYIAKYPFKSICSIT